LAPIGRQITIQHELIERGTKRNSTASIDCSGAFLPSLGDRRAGRGFLVARRWTPNVKQPAMTQNLSEGHRLPATERDPAADGAALAQFGDVDPVDPVDWSIEAARALMAERAWGMRTPTSTLVVDAVVLVVAARGRSSGALLEAGRSAALVTTDSVVHEARRCIELGLRRPELLAIIDELLAERTVAA
jgi:hypothetical protein